MSPAAVLDVSEHARHACSALRADALTMFNEEAVMPTPFGAQLIGETEKTLNALLRRSLEGTGLTEPQWVTLRVADLIDDIVDADGLAAAVGDRAHFRDA